MPSIVSGTRGSRIARGASTLALSMAGLVALLVPADATAQESPTTRALEIEVTRAEFSAAGPGRPWDTVGSSLPDCYVVVEVDGEIVLVTDVARNTTTPRWTNVGTFTTDDFDERIVITLLDDDADDEVLATGTVGPTLADRQPMVRELDSEAVRQRMARDDVIAEGVFPLTDDEAHARTSIIIQFEDREGRVHGRIDAQIRPLPALATTAGPTD